MHTHTARLDDPKLAFDRTCAREGQKLPQAALEKSCRRRRAEFENHDSGSSLRRETRHLTEIAIERDQCAPLGRANFKSLISRAGEPLLGGSHDIMTSLSQKTHPASADVLIDLDFQGAGSTGTGMTRSRDASAP